MDMAEEMHRWWPWLLAATVVPSGPAQRVFARVAGMGQVSVIAHDVAWHVQREASTP